MNLSNVWARSVLVVLSILAGNALQAQTLRDPTQAPADAVPGPDGAVVSSSPLGDDGVAVVVRGGKPYLVSGTRLYAVGQKIGASRIERISETEVWLRNGTELQKIQRFAGIQRRVAAPAGDCAVSAGKPNKSSKPSSSTSPKVAPCAGAQP
jgi:hypothetical protein